MTVEADQGKPGSSNYKRQWMLCRLRSHAREFIGEAASD